jgi:hypothetical protein
VSARERRGRREHGDVCPQERVARTEQGDDRAAHLRRLRRERECGDGGELGVLAVIQEVDLVHRRERGVERVEREELRASAKPDREPDDEQRDRGARRHCPCAQRRAVLQRRRPQELLRDRPGAEHTRPCPAARASDPARQTRAAVHGRRRQTSTAT